LILDGTSGLEHVKKLEIADFGARKLLKPSGAPE
jgi:hypothetical protein